MRASTRLTLLLVLVPAAFAFAESAQERQIREDLDRQLKAMVGTPPTKVLIEVEGLDEPNYEMVEASFKLDGRNLSVSDLKQLNSNGTHLVFHGDVQPGAHRLESRFEFRNTTTQVVSAEGGYKWKPGSDVSFKSESGIEVRIKVTPELHPKSDLKDRITVKSPATVTMLAKLDDGTMPAPVERPKIVAGADVLDAGVTGTASDAKKKAAEDARAAKLAAAEEKKRLADDAKAARVAAAEEKKRRADEAKAANASSAEDKKAARLAAAEEKKRKADEASAARQAAADEKKRAAEEKAAGQQTKVAANDTGKPGGTVEKPAPAVVEADAGALAIADVDAGPAMVAVAPTPVPVPAPVPPPASVAEESSSIAMVAMIGVGVAVVALLLFLIARRKKD